MMLKGNKIIIIIIIIIINLKDVFHVMLYF